MKKILCPTDFSDAAHNAIAYAAKFAQTGPYKLTLFHVQSLHAFVPAEMTEPVSFALAQDLEAQSDEVTRTFKVPCDSILEPCFRKLSSVIEDYASDYDLIIMGSNGPDNLSQFFLGSNAYKAAIKTSTPVLIIPAGCIYSEIRSIVFAFDYLQHGELPVWQLRAFNSALKSAITILQVMKESRSQYADRELKDAQAIIRNYWADEVPLNYDTIWSDDTAQSIAQYTSRVQPDVLAVCSMHMSFIQRLFHKSVIMHLTATSNCPLLIFHE